MARGRISPGRWLRRVAAGLLMVLVLLFALLALRSPDTLHAARLLAPTWFGAVRVAPQLLVDASMPAAQRSRLVRRIAAARGRMIEVFDGLASGPRVLACSSETCFRRFGGVTAKAKAFGAHMLLLSPRGLSLRFIVHEWVHAEIVARLGVWTALFDVPRWFDEGLAVTLSEDPRCDRNAWSRATSAGEVAPALAELSGRRAWLRLSRRGWQHSYGTACLEVRRWLALAGRQGLADLLRDLGAGRAFEKAMARARGGAGTR